MFYSITLLSPAFTLHMTTCKCNYKLYITIIIFYEEKK